MTTGTALIKVGLDAGKAAEALEQGTKVTPARRQLNLADQKGILGALTFTVEAIYDKKSGLLAHTLRLIEARQAHYEQMGDAGRGFAAELSTIHGLTSHAQTRTGEANVGVAWGVVRSDVKKLADRHSPAAEPAPKRGKAVERLATDATTAINQFAGAISPDDGLIYDIVTCLGSGSDIVHALQLACYHEVELVNSAYRAAKMERAAASPSETLRISWMALHGAQQLLADATARAKVPSKRESDLIAAAG